MTAYQVRVLEREDGQTVVVQALEHEPHWKTVAMLRPDALIPGADGQMKPVSEATNEEIIAAVAKAKLD